MGAVLVWLIVCSVVVAGKGVCPLYGVGLVADLINVFRTGGTVNAGVKEVN